MEGAEVREVPQALKISVYSRMFKHSSTPNVVCCLHGMGSHQDLKDRKALAYGGSSLSFLEVSVGRN